MKLTRPEPITNPRGNPDQDAAIERETQMDAMRKTIARLTAEAASGRVRWCREMEDEWATLRGYVASVQPYVVPPMLACLDAFERKWMR